MQEKTLWYFIFERYKIKINQILCDIFSNGAKYIYTDFDKPFWREFELKVGI